MKYTTHSETIRSFNRLSLLEEHLTRVLAMLSEEGMTECLGNIIKVQDVVKVRHKVAKEFLSNSPRKDGSE